MTASSALLDYSAIRLTDRSNVAEARRAAAAHARRLGWSDAARGESEIVATELATNVVKHARDGVLSMTSWPEGPMGVLLFLTVDRGPGMSDPLACLADGFSTAGSPGTGLGAIGRLAQTTDIVSTVEGTVVVAELTRPGRPLGRESGGPAGRGDSSGVSARGTGGGPSFQVAGFSLPKEGQIVNGDAWSYRIVDGTLAVLVCDGLGHGAEAARASTAAVECFLTMDWSGPGDALESIDRALRPTRGAAAAIGVIDDASGILTFCGVGNIVAGIVADGKTRHLVSQNGILGAGARRLTEFAYAWTRDATLVMHSDGISGRWQSERAPHLWSRHPALVAGALYRDLARGTDDVAVVGVRQHA